MFAEFLPFILVFPGMRSCVGLTINFVEFSSYLCSITFLSGGIVSYRWWVRSDLHMRRGEGRSLLLLILAGSFPGFVGWSDSGWGV